MHASVQHARVGLGAALASVVIAGCGSGGTTTTPGEAAGVVTGSPAPSPSNSEPAAVATEVATGDDGAAGDGLCALFTTDEMANVLDRPVQAGEVGGPLDTLCQWVSEDWEADVFVQRVDDPDFWDPPSGEEGYVAIDIGDEAYVAPWLDGRTAAAREGSSLYYVSIAPAPDDDEILIDLLIEFMQRSSG